MDDRGMKIWYEKIWKPCLSNYAKKSLLLLDDFKCHKQPTFDEKLSELNTERREVPPGYTSILQPCDMGINKVLKSKLRSRTHNWRTEQAALLGPGEALPAPTRANIALWLHEVWQEMPTEMVCNAWHGCGYTFERGENYTYETEFESEISCNDEYEDLPFASEDDTTDEEAIDDE